jgi:hypothetical protein
MAKWKKLPPSPEAIVRAALERAANAARGEYKSTSLYDQNSPFYGMDLNPDRSDFGRGKDRGRENAAKNIRSLASDPAYVAAIIKAAGEDRG